MPTTLPGTELTNGVIAFDASSSTPAQRWYYAASGSGDVMSAYNSGTG